MSLRRVHLWKLLRIFYSSDSQRKALLREDIRNEKTRGNSDNENGGDFHGPFWADAKRYVVGLTEHNAQMPVDLWALTKARIESNKRRQRLYLQLTDGFLRWWEEKRRWRNEPFELISRNVKGRLPVPQLNGSIKVENLVAVKIGGHSNRLVYPYFSEEPALSEEGARIGLWVLSEAIADYPREEFQILDVLRSTSFGIADLPLKGDERELLMQKYAAVLEERENLRREDE
jgi:hypothetical protein